MKIVTLGGGSARTPDQARALLRCSERIGIGQWWLVDADPARLHEMGGIVERMVERGGAPFRVRCSTHREEALEGADFVVTQIRVGGAEAQRLDERLCRRWRLMHHEATGVGGMAGGLRTVPVLVDVAEEMRVRCPGAWLINVTHPGGILVEALQQEVPDVRSVGICAEALRVRDWVAEETGIACPQDVQLDYLGLNHLTWLRGARAGGGEDLWKKAVSDDDTAPCGKVIVRLGLIWDYYVQTLSGRQDLAEAAETHGPAFTQRLAAGEGALLSRGEAPVGSRLSDEPTLEGAPDLVSTAVVHFIEAAVGDTGQEHILNTRQLGAVAGLPPEWVLEIPCRVFRNRVVPRAAEPLPVFARGLLEVVKNSELLTVEAALSGLRSTALAALLAHPLGPGVDMAEDVLEELFRLHRKYLPRFHPAFRSPGLG